MPPAVGQQSIELYRRDAIREEFFVDEDNVAIKKHRVFSQKLVDDLSFLRRVDLCDLDAFVVEKDLHLVKQELVRVGI